MLYIVSNVSVCQDAELLLRSIRYRGRFSLHPLVQYYIIPGTWYLVNHSRRNAQEETRDRCKVTQLAKLSIDRSGEPAEAHRLTFFLLLADGKTNLEDLMAIRISRGTHASKRTNMPVSY